MWGTRTLARSYFSRSRSVSAFALAISCNHAVWLFAGSSLVLCHEIVEQLIGTVVCLCNPFSGLALFVVWSFCVLFLFSSGRGVGMSPTFHFDEKYGKRCFLFLVCHICVV